MNSKVWAAFIIGFLAFMVIMLLMFVKQSTATIEKLRDDKKQLNDALSQYKQKEDEEFVRNWTVDMIKKLDVKIAQEKQAEKQKLIDDRKLFVRNEVTCLAENIYYEANVEPVEGKIAVGVVTVNRTKSGVYPNTICGVVKQKYENTCQFTWVCKTPEKMQGRKSKGYTEAYALAKQLYNHKLSMPELDGVLNYHADYVTPNWAQQMAAVTQIGRHIFYKDPQPL